VFDQLFVFLVAEIDKILWGKPLGVRNT
jgi:hypothetical protein